MRRSNAKMTVILLMAKSRIKDYKGEAKECAKYWGTYNDARKDSTFHIWQQWNARSYKSHSRK